MFNDDETFEPGSVARKLANALASACAFLDEAQPGWQYSPQKRAALGLDPEFGEALARHYIDWR